MMSDFEKRLSSLEIQVAELMDLKRQAEYEHIERSAAPAGDAFIISKDGRLAPKGVYCSNCWQEFKRLSLLDVKVHDIIQGISRNRVRAQCPNCRKHLDIE